MVGCAGGARDGVLPRSGGARCLAGRRLLPL